MLLLPRCTCFRRCVGGLRWSSKQCFVLVLALGVGGALVESTAVITENTNNKNVSIARFRGTLLPAPAAAAANCCPCCYCCCCAASLFLLLLLVLGLSLGRRLYESYSFSCVNVSPTRSAKTLRHEPPTRHVYQNTDVTSHSAGQCSLLFIEPPKRLLYVCVI